MPPEQPGDAFPGTGGEEEGVLALSDSPVGSFLHPWYARNKDKTFKKNHRLSSAAYWDKT